MKRQWTFLHDRWPRAEELPVTVVLSYSRPDYGVWTSYTPELTPEFKAEANIYFNDGEHVQAQDWFPPLA